MTVCVCVYMCLSVVTHTTGGGVGGILSFIIVNFSILGVGGIS